MSLMAWKEIVGLTATLVTVALFLSGSWVARKIIVTGTTGDISGLPFLAGLISSLLWTRYGIMILDHTVITVNVIGSFLQIIYLLIYLLFTIKKATILRQTGGATLFLLLVWIYSVEETNFENAHFRMGLICSMVTIGFFASPLANLAHVIQVKSTETLPFPVIILAFFTSLLWWIYGFIIEDHFVVFTNFIGFILSTFQLGLFVYFPSNSNGYVIINQERQEV